jgi:site-specific DNA recombinase
LHAFATATTCYGLFIGCAAVVARRRRPLIYTRYSSDLQSDRSNDDQKREVRLLLLTRFSHLVRTIRFATKNLTAARLTYLCLVAVICGCFGSIGNFFSTVLAQSPAELERWFLPLAAAMPLLASAVSTSTSRGASYTRFSSKAQDDRTITDQQRQCRERGIRDGYDMLTALEFADEAISGAKHSRTGFNSMMAAARAGSFKVLYFVNLSRLARDCVLTLQTMRELVYTFKVRVISIDEGIDTAQSDSWELIVAILSVQHQQYLKSLAQNVFRGQEGVVLDQLCVGDYCFGFASEPVPGTEGQGKGRNKKPKTNYIILWAEADWVRKIFNWFVVERQSLRWIARELNRLGAPKDHRATTAEWYHQLLLGLLSNEKYVGRWPWGENKNVRDLTTGDIHQEKRSIAETEKWLRHFPELQIIDDETFAKAQKLLEQNAEAHGKRRGDKGQLDGSSRASHNAHPRHMLSGLIECECCGRLFNVGGKNGKYLFCRGYVMGICQCQTTLRRDLAETLILEAISQKILSNPAWVELLLMHEYRSYEKLQHELPSRRRAIDDALSDVDARIAMLVSNSEKQIVPELETRMTELRTQRDSLRAELKKLLADEGRPSGPPTRKWLEERLADLRSVLTDHGPAAAHALRALVGGRIVVTEIKREGKQRHYLRGRMELRLFALAGAVGVQLGDESDADPATTEVVEIDFRRIERHEEIADEVKRLWDDGMIDMEITKLFGCSRTLISSALDHWYEKRGLTRPDGRSCKKRPAGNRKADKLQSQIMELWHQDLSVSAISEQLGCGLEIVREAVTKWHVERGLPVPDGRARRREIRLKRRDAV